jgi:hypothetical protein
MTHGKAVAIVSLAIVLSVPGYVIAGDNGHGNGQSNGNGNNGNKGQQNKAANAPSRLRVPLMATSAGTAIIAAGDVVIREQKKKERIRVQVEANVPDGTQFSVSANGTPIGTITINFNEGQLQIGTGAGETLPGGLSPDSVTTVTVSENGTAILEAQFAALNTVSAIPNLKRAKMTATAAGTAAEANGRVMLHENGARERLTVAVEANVPDGTIVTITGSGHTLGTVTIQMGEGEFEIDSRTFTLPSGLTSIGAITDVQVIAADGTVLLTASL